MDQRFASSSAISLTRFRSTLPLPRTGSSGTVVEVALGGDPEIRQTPTAEFAKAICRFPALPAVWCSTTAVRRGVVGDTVHPRADACSLGFARRRAIRLRFSRAAPSRPPTLAKRDSRPVSVTKPSASIFAMSPVTYQPFAHNLGRQLGFAEIPLHHVGHRG